jgi:tRNA (guanine37-N1)-methyltransferase
MRYALCVMRFHIITIFPEIFDSYFNESIIKRALTKEKIKINIINLRDFTEDKHKTVDDTPYGGGAGMVMKVEPLYAAVSSIKYQVLSKYKGVNIKLNTKYLIPNTKIVLTSAKGKTWNQQHATDYSKLNDIIIICGRYEGVDERITNYIDEEISIGDYVMTGGELGAMVVIDSITRLLPGVVGNAESPIDESHNEEGVLEYPQYTRPEVFKDDNGKEHTVPDVLLSGHHKEIKKWREGMKKKK